MISVRTLDPRSEILKYRSSPAVGVTVVAMCASFAPAPAGSEASTGEERPKHREVGGTRATAPRRPPDILRGPDRASDRASERVRERRGGTRDRAHAGPHERAADQGPAEAGGQAGAPGDPAADGPHPAHPVDRSGRRGPAGGRRPGDDAAPFHVSIGAPGIRTAQPRSVEPWCVLHPSSHRSGDPLAGARRGRRVVCVRRLGRGVGQDPGLLRGSVSRAKGHRGPLRLSGSGTRGNSAGRVNDGPRGLAPCRDLLERLARCGVWVHRALRYPSVREPVLSRRRPRAPDPDLMAKKKRKQRHRPGAGPERDRPATTETAERGRTARSERKDQVRRARETALRRIRRRRAIKRAAWMGGLGAVTFVAFFLLTRVGGPKPIPEAALAAASDAGCGDVQTPAASAPGGIHLSPGESHTYAEHPATSGPHDPSPLPGDPHVYDSPVPETRAVHNLEHAYVLIYYRANGPDALPKAVVDRLASLARTQDKVIMAPHPDLPSGTSFALAAWNKLWECPAAVTADQARTIASGFIQAYRGTSNAPEPRAA